MSLPSLWALSNNNAPTPTTDIATLRQALATGQTALQTQFMAGEAVAMLVATRSHYVDQVLQHLWAQLDMASSGACLVAVGGFGRSELHPYSDIDLLLLVDESISDALPDALVGLFTQLWDIGLEVGHSIRTVAECEAQATDITVATNLLESRYLSGDKGLFSQLTALTESHNVWGTSRFYRTKREEQDARYKRYNDTANNLEPNIKESPGGLRDLQVISWVMQQHFSVRDFHGLLERDFLTQTEYDTLIESQNFLWRVRFALHIFAGRKEERLRVDAQRKIATQFGYKDTDARLAVEQFMKDYYRCARRVQQMNRLLLQLFEESIILADEPCRISPINARFENRNDYLEVKDKDLFSQKPWAMLELFLILQQQPEIKGARASTIRQLRENLHRIDDRFRDDIQSRSLFMEIIRQPQGVTHHFRRMNQFDVLGAYLPNFGVIVGQMQHDMFHTYTVDEHTLFLVRNLRRFSCEQFADEFPLCSKVFHEIPKPELLYLAGLFHDIAKGRGGNHSELGVPDALAFCQKHDLSTFDSELVGWIVQQHLTMSATAQKKDTNDPEIVQEFASLVGTVDRLNYLYLLTVADIRATNENLWNNWRDSLLRQLYHNTRRYLESSQPEQLDVENQINKTQKSARALLHESGWHDKDIDTIWGKSDNNYFRTHSADEIAWQCQQQLAYPTRSHHVCLRPHGDQGTLELFISAADKPKLFATLVSCLDTLQLDVLDAKINITFSERALNTFIIKSDDTLDDAHKQEIKDFIRAQLAEGDTTLQYQPRFLSRTLKLFNTPPEIICEQGDKHTSLEIKTHNRPGLLSVIAQAFVTCNIQLLNAKIISMGDHVDNVFFIQNTKGETLSDAQKQQLQQQLHQSLTQ